MKKYQDLDYTEFCDFVKDTVMSFLDENPTLKEKYNFIEEFHGRIEE